MEQNMVGWFEVPTKDIHRAKAFYDKVFDVEIMIQDFGGVLMGWFPFAEDKPGAAGSLIQQASYEPSDSKGVLIYFASQDVNIELSRVVEAGGKVILEKRQISPDVGYMGLFVDSEGNRMALHSRE